MPSEITMSSPQIKRYQICRKGDKHAEQPLNLVCLDPICRNNPLICPTCFSTYHKYHKTIPLSQFLDDYQGAIKRNHKSSTSRRIAKQHEQVKQRLREFRSKVNQVLCQYESDIEEYFNFLSNSLNIREELSRVLNITLEPKTIAEAHSQSELQQSLKFIINHSLFDKGNRLVNVADLLKHDQSRTLALLDKVSNESSKFQTEIQQELNKLRFANQTLRKQSLRLSNIVKTFNQSQISEYCPEQPQLIVDPKVFIEKQTLAQTLRFSDFNPQNATQSVLVTKLNDYFSVKRKVQREKQNETPLFVFSNVFKHDNLKILNQDKQSVIKSNVTALKPQYALICPSVEYQPEKEQNWSIKINSCRNFASSKNTIAIGICSLQQIKNQNFEQNPSQAMKDQYIVTSEGFMIKNGREEKCDFRFSVGDVIDLKYDPYYNLLQMKKDNGRKITMKINGKQNENTQQTLYACVRLTYASDQVEVLNHFVGRH